MPSAILAFLQLTFVFYFPSINYHSLSKPESAIVEFSGHFSSAYNLNKTKEYRSLDNYKIFDLDSQKSSILFQTKFKAIFVNNVPNVLHISKFTPNKFNFRGPPSILI